MLASVAGDFAQAHAALSAEVLALYSHYGHAMHWVQNVELMIRGLFQLTLSPEERSVDNIEDHTADLFRRPLAKLAKRLDLSDDLTETLTIAVDLRNKMAHELPFMAAVRANTGGSSVEQETEYIDSIGQAFKDLHGALDAIRDVRLRRLGYDPDDRELSDEEIGLVLWGDGDTPIDSLWLGICDRQVSVCPASQMGPLTRAFLRSSPGGHQRVPDLEAQARGEPLDR
jgi:hypothetical protein